MNNFYKLSQADQVNQMKLFIKGLPEDQREKARKDIIPTITMESVMKAMPVGEQYYYKGYTIERTPFGYVAQGDDSDNGLFGSPEDAEAFVDSDVEGTAEFE